MAQVVITLKIKPESPQVNLNYIAEQATKLITDFGGHVGKTEEEPIAYGLKSLNIFFLMDEAKGSTQLLEEKLSLISGINSVDVVDVRRTIG